MTRSRPTRSDGSWPGLGTLLRSLLTAAILSSLSQAYAADTFSTDATTSERTPLVVLLLGGFRWDYLNYIRADSSGFKEFLNGASAKYVTTVFPSQSYPAWTTISTGVYPDDHGIIANNFFDRQRKMTFMLTNSTLTRKSFWWQSREPIWTSATKNGLRVATVFWSRSDVPVRGMLPEEAQGYEQTYDSYAELHSTLIRTVDYLGKGLELILAYNEHVDIVGHEYGPESHEMQYTIGDIDRALAHFFDALKKRSMYGKVNVVLISDHGMTSVQPSICANSNPSSCKSTSVDLQKILENKEDVEKALPQGPFVAVYAQAGRIENIMTNLRKVDGIVSYRRGEVPEYLHYNKHPWLPDIVICAKSGLSIKGSHWFEGKEVGPAGQHGYTPLDRDMRTIFLATGPDFKDHTKIAPIQLVDEYQLFCHLLRIRAKPNSGSWDHVRGLLKDEPAVPFGEEARPPRVHVPTAVPVPAPVPIPVQPNTSPLPIVSTTSSVPVPTSRPVTGTPAKEVEAKAHEEVAVRVSSQPKPPSLRQEPSAAVSHTTSLLFTSVITVASWYLTRYD